MKTSRPKFGADPIDALQYHDLNILIQVLYHVVAVWLYDVNTKSKTVASGYELENGPSSTRSGLPHQQSLYGVVSPSRTRRSSFVGYKFMIWSWR
jgi:hypothetical protein